MLRRAALMSGRLPVAAVRATRRSRASQGGGGGSEGCLSPAGTSSRARRFTRSAGHPKGKAWRPKRPIAGSRIGNRQQLRNAFMKIRGFWIPAHAPRPEAGSLGRNDEGGVSPEPCAARFRETPEVTNNKNPSASSAPLRSLRLESADPKGSLSVAIPHLGHSGLAAGEIRNPVTNLSAPSAPLRPLRSVTVNSQKSAFRVFRAFRGYSCFVGFVDFVAIPRRARVRWPRVRRADRGRG